MTTLPGLTAAIRQRRWWVALTIPTILVSLAGMRPLYEVEARPRLAPVPAVAITAPGQVFIGQDFTFSVRFDNTDPNEVGYGPIIDLLFPVNGSDGQAGTDAPDGIDFVGASYLGAPLSAVVLVFPDDDGGGPGTTGCVDHPFYRDTLGDPLIVCGTAADKLVVIELPFGSFAPDQPAAEVTIQVTLSDDADLDSPLTLRARGGFRYGADPLDNWCCDPVIVNPPSVDGAGWPSDTVTPTLLSLSKDYSGPEDETASGPNFPRQYTISVEIAPGQSISGLQVIDELPSTLQFVSIVGSSHTIDSCSTPSTVTPGGTLDCTFAGTVSGTVTLTFEYFVPLLDSGDNPVLPADSGDDRTSEDEASAEGTWTPTDTRDGPQTASAAGSGPEHILNDRSIAIQKSVSLAIDTGGAGPTPGDTLEYSLAFQVSDFFAFEDVVIQDTFSDGQLWDASFTPTLSLTEHAVTSSDDFAPTNVTVVRDSPGSGTTEVTFEVSQELVSRLLDGQILGGCVPDGGTGGGDPSCGPSDDVATTGLIVFRTVIQDEFTDDYPSTDPSVDQGDELEDTVEIGGDVLATADLSPTGQTEDDGSSAGTTIARGGVDKTIYAVNGVVWGGGTPQVAPDDTVTYRITYDMPASDVEDLYFYDYLPLPVFRVDDPDADGIGGPDWSFSSDPPGTIPVSGVVGRGPTDTFTSLFGVSPTVTGNAAENRLAIDYGTHDDPANRSSTIDLLFTVSVTADPFADGLYLTNQVRQHEGSTNATDDDADVIIQIQIQEPLLAVTKGVIQSDSPVEIFTPAATGPVSFSPPGTAGFRGSGDITSAGLGSTPVDSDLEGVDAGDLVSFAIVIENQGSSPHGAFDIRLRDTLPAGFLIPTTGAGLNLTISRGNGDIISYTPLGPGGTQDDLFANGLELIDPSDDEGVCQGHNLGSGANIVVVTYDLQVDPNAEPMQIITNTASVTQYASENGGPNFLDAGGPLTDQASVTLRAPELAKSLTDTNQGFTAGTNVAVGEIATYTLTVTVPEGTSTAANLTDTLDQGLAFVSLDSVTASSAALSWTGAASPVFAAYPLGSGLAVDQARRMTVDFGDLTNTDRDNATAETITLVYQVVVLDSTGNNASPVTLLNNSAAWDWSLGTQSASAPDVRVVEPWLRVTKTPAPASGDAGDVITFTITVSHNPTATPFISNAPAFEVVWSDLVPAGMTYVTGSLQHTAGLAPTLLSETAAPVLSASWSAAGGFPLGSTSTLAFQATLDSSVSPGQQLDNYAYLNWTGLPGDVSASQTPNNTLSTERYGPVQPFPPPLPGAPPAPDDYWVNALGRVTVTATPQKTLVTTSEGHTSGASVAIGEIARVRLQFLLAEGSATDFMLHDALPAGLRFLDDGTARAALVSNGTGITSSTLPLTDPSGNPLMVTGSETTIAGIVPSYVLPDSAVSRQTAIDDDAYASGGPVYFKFGTLANNDRDGDIEYVVVEFNVVVENVAGNQAYNNATGALSATTLRNRFRPRINGVFGTYSSYLDLRVTEPLITDLTKTVTVVPDDAGDQVVFRFVFSNSAAAPNAAAAFDISLSDTLDSFLIFQDMSLISAGGGDCGSVTPALFGGAVGQVVTATLSCLNPGATAVIEVTARVVDDAPIGATIANAVDLGYTSLPESGTPGNPTGSASGPAGSATGERSGSDGAGGLNDYVDSAALTPDLQLSDPAVTKAVFGTSVVATGSSRLDPTLTDLVIGETVTFHITLTLPEGVAPITLTDDLPTVPPDQGILTVVSSQVLSIGGNISGSALAVGQPGLVSDSDGDTYPDRVVFAFGSLTNTPDGTEDDNDRITVEVVALVENLAADQNGDVLVNQASLDFGLDSVDGSASVEVVEPELAIGKTASDDTPGLGDIITFTLSLSHLGSSTADANEIVVRDTVPGGLTYVAASASAPAGWTFDDSAAPLLVFSGSLPYGAPPAVLSYQAEVGLPPAVNVGDVFTNTAQAVWTSVAGSAAAERSGAGGVDDYAASSSETVTVSGVELRLTKVDGGLSPGPGDTIPYLITVENLGNSDASGVVISDTVPPYTSYSGAPGWVCLPDNDAGSSCSYALGALAAGASLDIAFPVVVDDPLPAGVTLTSNTASVADDGTHGIEPAPDDNSDTEPTPLIAAPDLTIAKDDGLSIVAPGSPLVYLLNYDNVGDQDASGVVVSETVPDGAVFDATASLPTDWSCADGSPGGTTCQHVIGDLPVGGGGTLTFAVTVADPPGVGQIVNTVTIADDGANGADQNPADNSASDTDNLVTLPDADLTKTVSATSQAHTAGLEAAIGEIVTYQAVLTIPPGSAPSAMLSDSLDPGLAFVDCLSLTPSAGLTTDHPGGFADSCANPSVAAEPPGTPGDEGRRVTFDLGSLDNPTAGDATLTLLYRAVALDLVESVRGDTQSNRVVWTWTGGELQERAPSITLVEPTLTLAKIAEPTVVPPGAPITMRLTVAQASSSDSDAFDLVLTDTLPSGLTFIGGLVHSGGLAPSSLSESGGIVTAVWDSFPLGSSSTIEFQVALENLPAGTTVRNEAALEWTSLPDDGVSAPFSLSPHNAFATERRYDPSTGADFYRVVADASVSIPVLPATGFPPGRQTALDAPETGGRYQAMAGARLIIPELGVDVDVVGVPTDAEGWDLSWLGSQAGYLYGTAYPTVPGNSALTGHVYLPDGSPGPFVDLASLGWDDEIIVVVNGLEHVYRVRQVRQVSPGDLSVLRHEEYSWLTLITCQGFDESRDDYRWRVAVRAVLVAVRSP